MALSAGHRPHASPHAYRRSQDGSRHQIRPFQHHRISGRASQANLVVVELALAILLIAAAYASLDEWRQAFVPLRVATPRDVAIDTSGALLAQSAVWWYATRKSPFAALPRLQTGVAKQQKVEA